MPDVVLPNNWRPRHYQMPVWEYFERGGTRAACVWHRRSGKDEVALHRTAVSAHERIGTYLHMLPEYAQARTAIWEAINPHTGKRRIDEAFPHEIRETTRDDEMFIRFKCGSTWKVVGSDNYDRLVGAPPVGMVFSEWSLAKPGAWGYFRPILAENKGWAFFIYTPRGRNHGLKTLELAKSEPGWFGEVLTAKDTGVIDPDILESERREYIKELGEEDGESFFKQEYYCSFDAALVGAYYARILALAEEQGRITNIPYDPALPVYTAWDLGYGDDTSIWFIQQRGPQTRFIDHYRASGHGLDHYAGILQSKPYVYAEHLLPHDANSGDVTSGKTSVQVLGEYGFYNTRVLPRSNVQDGINATRSLLATAWFDAEKCASGLESLRNYRREWDEKKKCFHDRPLHDWTSHDADAARTGALGLPHNDYRDNPERQRYAGKSGQPSTSWASAW